MNSTNSMNSLNTMNTDYQHKETQALRQTIEHVRIVQHLLASAQVDLLGRQLNHDRSKLDSPEWSRVLYKYDKEEFPLSDELLNEAQDHHHSNNRHHPQMFNDGINDMHIIDILEMIIDWVGDAYADNEDPKEAIKRKAEKYNLDPQLLNIFLNTADWAANKAYVF